MADGSSQLDIIFNLIAKGDGGKITQSDLELLKKTAEEVSEAGFKAGEALEKMQAGAGARTGTNTGAGLLSDPAKFFAEMETAQAKGLQLTKDQIAVAEQYAARLQNQITLGRLSGQETDKQTAALAKLTAALAPHRAEQERQSKTIEELKKNVGEESEQTEKSVSIKQRMREVVRGLAAEFSHAGTVISAFTLGPLSALIATIALAASKIRESFRERREIAAAALDVERLQAAFESIAEIEARRGAQNDRFGGLADEVGKIVGQLNEMNAALLLSQQLTEKLEDAQLKLDLEKIEGSGLSDSQKIQARSRANSGARVRKAQRDLSNLDERARQLAEQAGTLGATAGAYDKSGEGMDPDIAAAEQAAAIAKTTAETTKKFNEDAAKTAKEKIVKFRGGVESGLPVYDEQLAGFVTPEKAKEAITYWEDVLSALEKSTKETAEEAKAAAEQLEDMEKRQKAIFDQADAARKQAAEATARAESTAREAAQRRAGFGQENPIVSETESRKSARESDAAAQREAEARRKAFETYSGQVVGLPGASPGFIARNVPLPPQLDSRSEVNALMRELGDRIIKGDATTADIIRNILQRLDELESQKATRRDY